MQRTAHRPCTALRNTTRRTRKHTHTQCGQHNSTDDCGMDVTPGDGDACTYDNDGHPLPTPLPAIKVCGTNGVLFDSVLPVGGKLL